MKLSDDDNVVELPIKAKAKRDENGPMLTVIDSWPEGCNHKWRVTGFKTQDAHYLIREGETEVECGLCGTRLDPMFVLRQMAHYETQWHRGRARYLDEMKRLKERSRTKCTHCGNMTKISRD